LESLEDRVVPSTIVLGPSKDNTLYQSTAGDISNGAGPSFFAGETGSLASNGIRRGVIAFDIADNIPAGSTINSVTLSLHVANSVSGAQTVELHRLSADWGEGTSNAGANGGAGAPATTNDATWVYRFYNTAPWTNVGGDFVSTVSASASVAGIGSYTWGSTSQMVTDVQSWLNTPANNFGWIVLGNETTARSAKEFDSRESATVANRPTLTIDYTNSNAASTLLLSGFPSSVTAGVAGTETVTATNGGGQTDTSYTGTVHLTSSDPKAVFIDPKSGQPLPGNNYTFTAADAGVHAFSVTLETAGTNQSITANDAAHNFTGSQTGITVTPAAATSFVLSGFPAQATSGLPANETVTAKDPFGNTDTNYTGTVHLTSSDPAAVLPADHPYTVAEAGVHTFSVTLNTVGTQSIKATDTVKRTITGSQTGITVNPGPTVLDPNLAVRTVASGLGNPTNMTFLGDNDFLVEDRTSGKIYHVINGVVAPTFFDMGAGPIPNLPVNTNSERGLLGITLSPDFANDHLVYLYWTENNSGPAADNNVADTPILGNRVDRFVWNPVTSTFTFDRNIIRLHSFQNDGNGGVPTQMQGNHNGGVVQFGPDGKLYIVIGDNGRRSWMQNLIDGPNGPGQTDENNGVVRGGPAPDDAHLTGVMLRLNPDGSIPTDNPFADIRDVLQAQVPTVASPQTGLSPLTGANVKPNPTLSLGTGSFTAFLNQAEDTLTVIVNFQGLSGSTLAGGADISIGGVNDVGPTVLTLSDFPGGLSSGQFETTLTAADFTPDPADGINTFADAAQAMLDGNAYFTIHTTQNPGGEIRGQIGRASTPIGDEADIVNNLHKIDAYGIRNTFGFTFDPLTGKLWLEENGDQSFDKISIVSPGSNDGWVQSSAPLLNVDGSIDTAAIAEFKSIELRLSPNGPQQTRWPSSRIADTAQEALSRLVMLPGATYNPAVFSVRAEDPPAGLAFYTSSALGSQYQDLLFEGEARDFLTAPGQEEFDGALFVFHPNSDRTGLDFGGDPNIRTSDNVFQNFRDFDLNGDTSFLFGKGFGIGTDIVTGPNGDMYVVSETKGAVFEIYRKDAVTPSQQTNLVSDIANPPGGAPEKTDSNLKNPWGISFSATSPFWVSDQRTGVSTLYAGDRTQADGSISPITVNALVVTIPGGSPTGQVRNNTSDFKLANGNGNPASFIFATLGGTITAWNTGTTALLEATVTGASYTGLAQGTSSSGANFLYAANQSTGKIDVFDKTFTYLPLGVPGGGNFEDPNLPPGSPFKAFNVQNLNGTIYVTYDKVVTVGGVTDREHDGIVDAFDTNGNFLRRVVTGGVNAPWGLTLVPPNGFGPFAGGVLLVGNFGFGDGKINAYDPNTGQFLGNLTDANNHPIAIEGLWAIAFGNGGSGGDTNALYFAAGINRAGPNSFGAADGLFGSIRDPGPTFDQSHLQGGFETPNVGTGPSAYQYDPVGSAWTFDSSSGVAGNGSDFTSGNPDAPQGTQVAFLQATGSFSQSVTLDAGTYSLTFAAAQRGNYQASSQTFEVLVDGNVVGTFTPGDTSYAAFTTANFTVGAGTHTIAFQGLDPNGGDNTAFVDNVQLNTSGLQQRGFETPNVGTGPSAFQYDPTGSAWTFSGTAGVAGNGSNFTFGNPDAPEGTQVAFLQGVGSFSQSFFLGAGSYTLSFDAAQRGDYQASSQTFEVLADGNVVGTFKAGDTSYAAFTTASFTVGAGPHTVTFLGLDPDGGDNTAFIDVVQLNPV
jgi:uncharacterized protein (TIGR03118 family)